MATGLGQIGASELANLRPKIEAGERLSTTDCLRLWKTGDLTGLGLLANLRRESVSGNTSYYRPAIHVNYTGRPVPSCSLCNRVTSTASLLTSEEWELMLQNMPSEEIAELHLTGGPHEQLSLVDLCNLTRRALQLRPNLRLRAFTWAELESASRNESSSPKEVLDALARTGLSWLAGGALFDLTPDRPHLTRESLVTMERRALWIEAAAELRLRCELSWVFGDEDDAEVVAESLDIIRQLQDRFGIFECFTPLLFHWPSGEVEIPMPTGYNQLRAIAAGRLFLDNIPRVRGSWAALTDSVMQVAQWYGADDADSALIPATASTIDEDGIRTLLRAAGRNPHNALREIREIRGH